MASVTEKLHEIGTLILEVERHETTIVSMMRQSLEENAAQVENCGNPVEMSTGPPTKFVVPQSKTAGRAQAAGMNAVNASPVSVLANQCLNAADGVCTLCEVQDKLVQQTKTFFKGMEKRATKFEAYIEKNGYQDMLSNSHKFFMEEEATLEDRKTDILTGERVDYDKRKTYMLNTNNAELTEQSNALSVANQIHTRLTSIERLQTAIISLLHGPSDCQEELRSDPFVHGLQNGLQEDAKQPNFYLLTSGRATFRIACEDDEMGKTWECPTNQDCLQIIGEYLLKAPPDVKNAWNHLVEHEMLGPARSLREMRVARHFAHEREERALNLSRRERVRALRRGSSPKTLFVSVAKT